MKMSNDRKKDILLKSFDVLKKNYNENRNSIEEILVKMFKLDEDTAVELWKHCIQLYKSELAIDGKITNHVMYSAGKVIGTGRMYDIVLNTPEIKEALFSLTGIDNGLYVGSIIQMKITNNELETADELLQLLYDNKFRRDSWYQIMDYSIPFSRDEITLEAYDLLEMWCDKVDNEEERAKLTVKMLDFID